MAKTAPKTASPATETAERETVNRMALVKIVGKFKADDLPEQGVKPMALVYGVARAVKVGTTSIGDYSALVGQFVGKSLANGKEFAIAQIILPADQHAEVAAALAVAGKGASVEFAYAYGRQRAENGGSTQAVQVVITPAPVDLLASVEAKISAK